MPNQDSPQPCQHIGLARSEVGFIATCRECGVVQLNLQALTLRLEDHAFLALARMVSQASLRLVHMAQLEQGAGGEMPRSDAVSRPGGLH